MQHNITMPSSSSDSSSSASSSSSSSSSEEEQKGFAFDGQTYPTYQEMVAAKRERNRKVLEKSVGEISSALGSVFKGSKAASENKSRSASGNKKRKRRPSNHQSSANSGGGSVQSSLRRNPKRAARSRSTTAAHHSATSSISSQSHISSASCLSSTKRSTSTKRSRKTPRLTIPVPDIPDGQTELRQPCPEIGSGWIMRVRARKKKEEKTTSPNNKKGPTSDRVFISPTGRVYRNMNEVDRFLNEDLDTILSGGETTDANKSVSFADDVSSNGNLQQQKLLASKTTGGIMSEAPNKGVPTLISATIRSGQSSLLPKSIMVKDMSASLEHILLNGGRVQARESIWKDFVNSDPVLSSSVNNDLFNAAHNIEKGDGKRKDDAGNNEKADEVEEEEQMVHLSDWKLYHPITAQTNCQLNSARKLNDDTKRFGDFFGDDDSDISIPEEFLVKDETTSQSESAPSDQLRQYPQVSRETLPLNNPVKYNNMVRERHSYYTSKGPDCHWDEEYGDGIDPMTFVEECCRGNATETMDGGNTGCPEKSSFEHEGGDATSLMAKRYTSSLLQRCWDRAVHAASSTVAVSTTSAGQNEEPKATLDDANLKTEENDAPSLVLQNQTTAQSILQSEAMNVVDSILDILLTKDGNVNNLRQFLNGPQKMGNHRVDWRHVLKCLEDAARQETNPEQKEGASGPVIQVNGKPIPLNYISLKSLSMRLIERYGTETHKMPL